MSDKIFLKLNFDFWFYSGRNPWSFCKCGVYACVCVCLCYPIGLHDKSFVFYLISVGFEIVAATVFFCSTQAQFWMISEAILIPKTYARLQKIASNFSKFSGGGPQTPRRRSVWGFAPYRPPHFPKFLDPPPAALCRYCVTVEPHRSWNSHGCSRALVRLSSACSLQTLVNE